MDSTKVQILTAFLFHSLHYVALRIALTSITCLPLQGLPTVNSVCPSSETLYILLYQQVKERLLNKISELNGRN